MNVHFPCDVQMLKLIKQSNLINERISDVITQTAA